MVCPNCQTDSQRINISGTGKITCYKCGDFGETGGTSTDKILTRNADRVIDQQVQYEGDMIPPYIVDRNTNQVVVNEEFINLYPEQAAQTYNQQELKGVGQPDLKPQPEEAPTDIAFSGDESEAIAGIMQA